MPSPQFGHIIIQSLRALCTIVSSEEEEYSTSDEKSASDELTSYGVTSEGISDEFPKQNINQFEDDNSIKIIKDISPRTMTEEPKPNSAMETETECNGKSNGCQVRNGDKSTSHPIIQQFKSHVMTENPFFQVVMHPSYVGHSSDKKCRLAIPANFVRKHLMKVQCSVLLCNSSGKTWIATFKRRRIGERLYIRSGWDTFVRDNNIQ
ncbi:hypothetical protein Gotri_027803, partial [Gossypium trilobum]|nr:hypothetical protein [Gossypium trilobum]